MSNKVVAIIVTYNRKNLLKECINSLLNQSIKLEKIIIVNNNSSDGTEEYLELLKGNDKFEIYNLEKNIGGAGGFTFGLEKAYKGQYDFFWIMDDDTIPNNNALEELLKFSVLNNEFGFLCSNILWNNFEPCTMNVPKLSKNWNKLIKYNSLKVDAASFVSIMFSRKALEECGLPIKEFFIWGDDLEFTKRISKKFDNYLILSSIAIHKMASNLSIDIVRDNNRLERYFYEYRNKFYISKKDGIKEVLRYLFYVLKSIARILLKKNNNKCKKIIIVIKGLVNGLMFNPNIKYLNQ